MKTFKRILAYILTAAMLISILPQTVFAADGDYSITNGYLTYTFNEKTGELVAMKQVTDENDIMIITTAGTIIRMHADSISRIGRASRGVRVMNVKDSLVATVDVTEREEDAEVAEPEETELPEEERNAEIDDTEDTGEEATFENAEDGAENGATDGNPEENPEENPDGDEEK